MSPIGSLPSNFIEFFGQKLNGFIGYFLLFLTQILTQLFQLFGTKLLIRIESNNSFVKMCWFFDTGCIRPFSILFILVLTGIDTFSQHIATYLNLLIFLITHFAVVYTRWVVDHGDLSLLPLQERSQRLQPLCSALSNYWLDFMRTYRVDCPSWRT